MRFVGTEIIEHDNVSGSECRDKDLPDIELEQFAVDWASTTQGASMRSWRRAARKVMVFQ